MKDITINNQRSCPQILAQRLYFSGTEDSGGVGEWRKERGTGVVVGSGGGGSGWRRVGVAGGGGAAVTWHDGVLLQERLRDASRKEHRLFNKRCLRGKCSSR